MEIIFDIGDKIYKQKDIEEYYQNKVRVFHQFANQDIVLIENHDNKGDYFQIQLAKDHRENSLLELKLKKLNELKTRKEHIERHAIFINHMKFKGGISYIYSMLIALDIDNNVPKEYNEALMIFAHRWIEINKAYNHIKANILNCNNPKELLHINFSEMEQFHVHQLGSAHHHHHNHKER